jgi:hypothetical protein
VSLDERVRALSRTGRRFERGASFVEPALGRGRFIARPRSRPPASHQLPTGVDDEGLQARQIASGPRRRSPRFEPGSGLGRLGLGRLERGPSTSEGRARVEPSGAGALHGPLRLGLAAAVESPQKVQRRPGWRACMTTKVVNKRRLVVDRNSCGIAHTHLSTSGDIRRHPAILAPLEPRVNASAT